MAAMVPAIVSANAARKYRDATSGDATPAKDATPRPP